MRPSAPASSPSRNRRNLCARTPAAARVAARRTPGPGLRLLPARSARVASVAMTSRISRADDQAGEQPAAGPPGARASQRRLAELTILGALSAFGPLSMDMYLPATPSMATDLHATQSLVQLTMSGCLAGL